MDWDEYCEDNASTPSADGWLGLVASLLIVVGTVIIVLV